MLTAFTGMFFAVMLPHMCQFICSLERTGSWLVKHVLGDFNASALRRLLAIYGLPKPSPCNLEHSMTPGSPSRAYIWLQMSSELFHSMSSVITLAVAGTQMPSAASTAQGTKR